MRIPGGISASRKKGFTSDNLQRFFDI